MIFHTLVRRQRYLLTLIAIALSIFYSLPAFGGSSWFSLPRRDSYISSQSIVTEQPSLAQNSEVSLFQQLDLTPKQQQQIKQIHRRYQQQVLKRKQTISRLQQQLSDMMIGTEPAETLRAKNQQLNNLRQEMNRIRFESMLATREILTLQQRQEFRELVKEVSAIE